MLGIVQKDPSLLSWWSTWSPVVVACSVTRANWSCHCRHRCPPWLYDPPVGDIQSGLRNSSVHYDRYTTSLYEFTRVCSAFCVSICTFYKASKLRWSPFRFVWSRILLPGWKRHTTYSLSESVVSLLTMIYYIFNYLPYFIIVVRISNLACMYIILQTIEVHTSSNLACMYIMLQTTVYHTHPHILL